MPRQWTRAERRQAVVLAEQRLGLSADDPPSRRSAIDLLIERGYSGTRTHRGTLAGDSLDRIVPWQLPARWDTIRKMTTDPDVAAVTWALTLPILGAPFEVQAGTDDPVDENIASTISRDLDNMSRSLQEHRAEVLDYLVWGNRVFETVFAIGEDGLWHPRKLALRPSETISDWRLDEHGGPKSLVQVLEDGEEVEMEMDRLLVFSRGRRGGDLTGQSILRPAYGSWYAKDQLMKLGLVAVEKHGSGTPTLLYRGHDPEHKAIYEQMLMGVHANEKGYLLLTEGVESLADFQITGAPSVLDPVSQMEFHRAAIYRSTLTAFLLLAGSDIGSFALSNDQSNFFMLALQAIMQEIEDVYNRYFIPRWVAYNWPGVPADRLPAIKHGALDRREVDKWFAAVSSGLASGTLVLTDELQRRAHDLVGVPLPEHEEDLAPGRLPAQLPSSLPKGEPPTAGGDSPDGGSSPFVEAPLTRGNLARTLRSEAMIAEAGVRVNFGRMSAALDEWWDKTTARLVSLQQKASRYGIERASRVIRAGRLKDLERVSFAHQEEADAIYDAMAALYEQGEAEAAEEYESLGLLPMVDDLQREQDLDRLRHQAEWEARNLAARMTMALGHAVIAQLDRGDGDTSFLELAIQPARDNYLRGVSAGAVTRALAMGRAGVHLATAAAAPDLSSLSAGEKMIVAMKSGWKHFPEFKPDFDKRRDELIVNHGMSHADAEDRVRKEWLYTYGDYEWPSVSKFLYTAVMDKATCDKCFAMDGTVFGADEIEGLLPYKECKGRLRDGTDHCRCQLVALRGAPTTAPEKPGPLPPLQKSPKPVSDHPPPAPDPPFPGVPPAPPLDEVARIAKQVREYRPGYSDRQQYEAAARNWYENDLTPLQQERIEQWIRGEHPPIRAAQEARASGKVGGDAAMEELLDQWDDLMSRAPRYSRPVELHRGTALGSRQGREMANMPIGSTIVTASNQSWAEGPGGATTADTFAMVNAEPMPPVGSGRAPRLPFVLHVETRQGVDLRASDANPDEQEHILPFGTRLMLVKREQRPSARNSSVMVTHLYFEEA